MAKIESYLDKQGIRSMQVGLYGQERTDKTDLEHRQGLVTGPGSGLIQDQNLTRIRT